MKKGIIFILSVFLILATIPILDIVSGGYRDASVVLVDTTDPSTFNASYFDTSTLTAGSIVFSDGTTFKEDNSNLFWDDTNNRLGIGTATPVAPLEIQSLAASMRQTRYSDTDVQSAGLTVQRSGGTTIGTDVVVQNGWRIANFNLRGYDGAAYRTAASIQAFIDGSPGLGDMPGRLIFLTTADGASSATERMRIDSSGNIDFFSGNLATTGTLSIDNAATFNSGESEVIFTVMGDGNPELFIVDASANTVKVNALTFSSGSIIDSGGSISFGDEALSTTGTLSSGTVTITNANAGSLLNEVSTATNPTIVPNRASSVAGLGGASGEVDIITSSLSRMNVDSVGNINFQSGNLTTIGTINSGNLNVTGDINGSTTLNLAGGGGIWTPDAPIDADRNIAVQLLLDTPGVITTAAGFAANRGYRWLQIQENGVDKLSIDDSAGGAIRFYAPGRMDFESAGQMFFQATSLFAGATFIVAREGDAVSTATQRNSKGTAQQVSLWTGSSPTKRYHYFRGIVSTATNMISKFAIFMNSTSTLNTGGKERFSVLNTGEVKIGNTDFTPRAKLEIAQEDPIASYPTLYLNQTDIDDVFVNFVGTSAADGSRSISSDTTEDSAKFGAIQIEINGVTKWLRVYDTES